MPRSDFNKYSIDEQQLFWKKKVIISFVLSILVFTIHIHSFEYYEYYDGVAIEYIRVLNTVFTRAFSVIAVPLFFILSGALFFRNYSNKSYFKKIKSRTKTLVIPYLFWNSLPLVSLFVKFVITKDYNASFGNTNFFLTIFHYESNFIFWFLFDLIVFVFISPLFDLLLKNKIIAFLALATMIVLTDFGIKLPESVFYSYNSIIYYFIGCIIGKYYFNLFCRTDYKRAIITISGVVFLICSFLSFCKEYYSINCFNSLYVILLVIYVGSFWILSNAFVTRMKLYDFYSYSFMIYALHAKISIKLSEVLFGILPKNSAFSIINFIITLAVTVVLICLISKVLKRFVKPVYIFITGSR